MRKCRLGSVHSVTDGAEFSGCGFVIYDDIEKPRLTLSYSNKGDSD
jgi:hypothetical protein